MVWAGDDWDYAAFLWDDSLSGTRGRAGGFVEAWLYGNGTSAVYLCWFAAFVSFSVDSDGGYGRSCRNLFVLYLRNTR